MLELQQNITVAPARMVLVVRAGTQKIVVKRHIRLGQKARMDMACTTCMAMCGSGAAIGMVNTATRMRLIRKERHLAPTVLYAAAAGTMMLTTAVQPIVTTTTRTAGAAT